MKRKISSLLLLVVSAIPASAQEPFTYETDTLLFSQADLNGDGRRDAVIVDKTTGAVRNAYQQSSGTFVWSDPQPGGIESPESLSVGRFLGPAADAFAIGSTTANRIHLAVLGNPAEIISPFEVFPAATGPSSLAAFDIDGTGVTDLIAICEGTAPLTNKGRGKVYEAITALNVVPAPTQAWTRNFSGQTERVNPARPKTGVAPRLCEIYFTSGASTAAFYLELPGPAGLSAGISLGGIPSSSRYLAASLDATNLTHFVFWSQGSTSLRAARIQEPTAGNFTFGTLNNFTLPKSVSLVVPVQTGAGARIGVMFADGTASVYDFDGAAAPVLRGAVPGSGFDLLLPVEGGDFLTVAGLSGASPAWTRQHWNGSAYVATQSGTLLRSRPSQQVSNIVFLSAEPFVNAVSVPKKLTHFREWTSSATVSNGSAWTFQSLAYVSAGGGLGGQQSATLSGTSTTDFPLINQYTPTLSIFTTDNRSTEALGDVLFSPPPGTYASPPVLTPLPGAPAIPNSPAVTVTISPSQSGGRVFYRTQPTADFTELASPGQVPIVTTTTLTAYVKYNDGTRSPMRSATYTVTAASALAAPAGGPDADNDGLPDAWEQAFNITSPSADADADGASNLAEFQGGTDPQSAASFPVAPLALNASETVIGNTRVLRLEWPASDTAAVLESSSNLTTWSEVRSGVVQTGSVFRFDVPLSAPSGPVRYYRLKR